MKNTNQMNGLYPIIRRVRRPLLPTDRPADAKPAQPPANTEQQNGNETPDKAAGTKVEDGREA
jgi:hypothetical protein